MKEIEIRVGGEEALQKFAAKWTTYDRQTLLHYWKTAKRRGHLLVIHPAAGGWGMLGVVPPQDYDLQTRKIPNRYVQTGHLGVALPANVTFVFGPEDFLKHYDAEQQMEAMLPKGGDDLGDTATKPRPKPARGAAKPRRKSRKARKPNRANGTRAKIQSAPKQPAASAGLGDGGEAGRRDPVAGGRPETAGG